MKLNGERIWWNYIKEKDVYIVNYMGETFLTKEKPVTDSELEAQKKDLEQKQKDIEIANYLIEHPEYLQQFINY